jgi:hypothetical protein
MLKITCIMRAENGDGAIVEKSFAELADDLESLHSGFARRMFYDSSAMVEKLFDHLAAKGFPPPNTVGVKLEKKKKEAPEP